MSQATSGFGTLLKMGSGIGPVKTLALSAALDDIVDTTTPHGFVAGNAVKFTGLVGGAGLVNGTTYYVIAGNLAANTFQVAAAAGGAAINFTTDITAGSVSLAMVFATIAEVKDIGGPGFAADTIEVTNQSSPSAWREYIASLLDAGEVSFDCNFLPSDGTQDDVTGLQAVMFARELRRFQILWAATPVVVCEFPALVTGFEPSAPLEDALTASVTLKVTGEPTFGPVV